MNLYDPNTNLPLDLTDIDLVNSKFYITRPDADETNERETIEYAPTVVGDPTLGQVKRDLVANDINTHGFFEFQTKVVLNDASVFWSDVCSEEVLPTIVVV